MKLLSWYASFDEELRGLRGTFLGWQKYYVCCSVCFVYRMQSKLQCFFLFFASFFKAFCLVANYFWSCSIFFIWCHLSFFMMNWKDYNLSKYTIIGKCKCMLYQINKLWWLFFNSTLRTLRSLKTCCNCCGINYPAKWNGGWKKVIFRPNKCLYFRFWNCHPHREIILNGLVPNPPRVYCINIF